MGDITRMTAHPHRQSRRNRLRAAFATRSRTYRARGLLWRLLAPAVFIAAGALFVTSMVTSQGTDLRAGRYDDLEGLATAEAKDLETLRTRATELDREVERLSQGLGRTGDRVEQRKVDALEGPVGLLPVRGPGMTISLDDAPDDVLAAADGDVSDLIVHQQDIQAVANALWAGGAEAMTIAGQRVVATTGIKCVGNTVVLHGVPHSPPYRISAVGPTGGMRAAVNASPYIDLYLESAEKGLGWDVREHASLSLPGYEGPTELRYARSAAAAASDATRS
jgi:uncharacterized protein YlxW (UPF0749 family)